MREVVRLIFTKKSEFSFDFFDFFDFLNRAVNEAKVLLLIP